MKRSWKLQEKERRVSTGIYVKSEEEVLAVEYKRDVWS